MRELFDRRLIRLKRERAALDNFLSQRVAKELKMRLDELGNFKNVLDVGGALDENCKGVIKMDLSGHIRGVGVVGDEEALPFAQKSFGLVVSFLGLHRVNDIEGVLRGFWEVLSEGVFLGATFGAGTLWELQEVLVRTEQELHGGVSPRVLPFRDVRDFGNLLQAVGFARSVADRKRFLVRYKTVRELIEDLRKMGETNVLRARRDRFVGRKFFERAQEIYEEQFSCSGQLEATFDIVYLAGWKERL